MWVESNAPLKTVLFSKLGKSELYEYIDLISDGNIYEKAYNKQQVKKITFREIAMKYKKGGEITDVVVLSKRFNVKHAIVLTMCQN